MCVGKMENKKIIKEINEISKVLDAFILNKKIIKDDVKRVFPISINTVVEAQAKMLNDGRVSLETQRILFGALRNIKNVMDSMYLSLYNAPPHENPTTAERCKEIVPLMTNVTNGIDKYFKDGDERELNRIFTSSRALRKNSVNLGFSKTLNEEFKELSMSPKDINDFINTLNKTIATELEIS